MGKLPAAWSGLQHHVASRQESGLTLWARASEPRRVPLTTSGSFLTHFLLSTP